MDKVVLAYSGGLDTSVAIRWLQEKYNMDVIAVTVDVGNERDLPAIQEKALKIGAIKAQVIDAKDLFVKYFVFPALQAGAIYEGTYPLATALARPLISKLLVDVAREEGAVGDRPRLHRQGQRPGALRRLRGGPGPGSEDHRPGPRVADDPRRRDRVRRRSTTSPSPSPRPAPTAST